MQGFISIIFGFTVLLMLRPLASYVYVYVYVYACVASKDHVMLTLMVASLFGNRDLKIQRRDSNDNVA